MYKVILVEDEKTVRDSIRKCVDWSTYGFLFIGEAANGEQALEIIRETGCEIVITDIRMPFMDGIELSRILRTLYPSVKIIILSGYMEFQYAQEAIRYGVSEYLLKPVTPAKLVSTLLGLKEKLDEELKASYIMENLFDKIKHYEANAVPQPSTEMNAKDLEEEIHYETELIAFLKHGMPEEIDGFLEHYIKRGKEREQTSYVYASWQAIQMLTACTQVVRDLGGDSLTVLKEFQDVDGFIRQFVREETVMQKSRQLIETVVVYRIGMVDSGRGAVTMAKEYIRSHLDDTNLTLHAVAAHVGLSSNHFSYIFKQGVGVNFIKYLTNVRVDYARELLRTTDLSGAQIAEKVGFNDPNYFSVVFKKICGMTPREYRNG